MMRNASVLHASLMLLLAGLGAGCGPSAGTDTGGGVDAGTTDGGGGSDGGGMDGGRDTGSPVDGGGTDGGGTDTPTDSAVRDGGGDTPGGCADSDLGTDVGAPVTTGTTAGATRTAAPECASGDASPARFFSWTAPTSGTYVITTDGSEFDTALLLLDGSCTGPELDCSDDTDVDTTSWIGVDAEAGHTYVIVVAGYDPDESGNFVLNIVASPIDEVGACTGGVDDDRDGVADCEDSDCSDQPGCIESNCADAMDDDDDGDVDCFDFDCQLDAACAENCTNGIDDDTDGDTDCDDLACNEDPACSEQICDDGLDDDDDGATDCEDFDCEDDPACGSGASCAMIFCIPEFTCIDCPGGGRCVPPGTTCDE